ncbi:hypothetical protein Pcinc_042601 [Petrolisthes cinctipes]|uniref:Uncharacterized protein n=1 Tax=Petrolisthes cinctipes TaxID=88211 RepID=A0AAE1EGV0_PETCI|nr:hypothetical protein Pcinc_042601 [Petrolisthes cinctipes]
MVSKGKLCDRKALGDTRTPLSLCGNMLQWRGDMKCLFVPIEDDWRKQHNANHLVIFSRYRAPNRATVTRLSAPWRREFCHGFVLARRALCGAGEARRTGWGGHTNIHLLAV